MKPQKSRQKPKARTEKPATPLQGLQAWFTVNEHGGATRPPNPLVSDSPLDTLIAARQVVDWLVHIEQPFTSDDLRMAEAYVLRMVRDAVDAATQDVRLLHMHARKVAKEAQS